MSFLSLSRCCIPLGSLLALFLVTQPHSIAQQIEPTTEGREFWLAFQKNFRDSIEDGRTDTLRLGFPLELAVKITSREKGTGFIEAPGVGFYATFSVESGEVTTIPLDPSLQILSCGVAEKLGVRVSADVPISVCAVSHRFQTTDTYLALPTNALGTLYRAVGREWLAKDLLSQFAILAVEDGTRVTITPSMRTKMGTSADVPFTVVLERGETYQIIPAYDPESSGDLTGSLIESDKPIALFSGHNCAYVPYREWKACNLLIEQLPPVDAWGNEFVVGMFADMTSSVVRAVAHSDGTEVFANGKSVATLNAGEYYENRKVTEPLHVTSTDPILLVQFATGASVSGLNGTRCDSAGDPMMIMIPPVHQYTSSYRIATPMEGAWKHYVNLFTTRDQLESMRIDGNRVEPFSISDIPGTPFVIVQSELSEGAHLLEAERAFGAYCYGFGLDSNIYDAYGNIGGQRLTKGKVERRSPTIAETGKKKEKKEKKENKKKKDENARDPIGDARNTYIAPPISPPAKEEEKVDHPTIE